MKSSFLKKSFASVITLSMLLGSTQAFAAATPATSSIPGDSTVDNPALNVVLPVKLDFALNPLEVGTGNVAGNQIKQVNYSVINKTYAPVKVSFDITATGEADVAFVSSKDDVSPDDFTVKDKEAFFGALGAKSITGDPEAAGVWAYEAPFNEADPDDTAVKDTLVAFTPDSADETKAKGAIEFVLDEATDNAGTPEVAANNAGAASFQMYAKLNTYADWQDGDIKVVGTCTLIPLRPNTYTTLSAAGSQAADGFHQLKPAVSAGPVGFLNPVSPNTATKFTYELSKTANPDTVVIPFNMGGKTFKAVLAASGTALPAGNFTLENGKFTILATRVDTLLSGTTAGTTTVYRIQLSDDSTYELTVKIVA